MARNKALIRQIKFNTSKYLSLPVEIRKKIRDASFRREGLFCEAMYVWGDGATINVAFLNDEVVGWAVHFFEGVLGKETIYIYVKRKYRRNGIGTKLLSKLIKKFPNADVCPHDKISEKFFINCNINTDNIMTYW